MQTFLEYKTRLRAEMWPAGESRALRLAHDPFFNEAMMDAQRWVPCLKQFNVSTWDFADTHWDDAKTVVNAPWGEIRRVYTIAGGTDRWRDKVRYRSGTYEEALCWSRGLYAAITPTNAGLPELPRGLKYADVSQDSPYGRAQIGQWSVDRRRLYISPYLQSYETLVVEWDGEKSRWSDSDGVDETYWTSDVDEAVKYYVLFKHELMWGDRQISRDFKALYDAKLADLMYKCLQFTRAQEERACSGTSGGDQLVGITDDRVDDDDESSDPDTTEEDEVLFNAVGDLGDPGTNTTAVAEAVASDNPEIFFALGDLTYNDDFAADFGVNYQSFLDAGNVVPVIGNHDKIGGTFDDFKAYFAAVIGNNGQNYERTIGPVHILVYNSEDTGNINAASGQAEWLRAKLLLSTARWKIVLMHRPPFSSDTTHGSDTDLQLPFKAWGADLVLTGHAHTYERIVIDDFPYIIVGTGGRPLYAFGAPVSGSVFRNNETYGRLIGEVTCDEMKLTYKTVYGAILDTFTITKP